MARRSSVRLAGRASTPKRVSLSHDQPQANTTRTPRTVPAKLSSLDENDEMPGAFPQSPDSAPLAKRQRSAAPTDAHTPTENRSIQPSDQEMHPQRLHQTTAKPLDEARHLGFTQMPQTEPAGKKSHMATAQATPSRSTRPGKASNPAEDTKSPTYQFTFRREHSLELSPDAKRLMLEKREEAQRIREQMVRSGEGSDANTMNTDDMGAGRKLAKPKGRFSEIHGKAFDKMASIAGHKSAFRSKENGTDAGLKTPQQGKERTGVSVVEAAQKSLKRSPSKAQLDEPAEKKSLAKSPSKSNVNSGLPRAKQTHTLPAAPEAGPGSPSPVKRQRRVEDDNLSSTRPSSRDTPSTPQQQSVKKSVPSAISYPNLSALTTPTQSSLARAASTKKTETKIPGPQLACSPSKPNLKSADVQQHHHAVVQQEEAGPSTPPLLQRSPSKSAHLFAGHTPAHFGQSQSRQPNDLPTGKGDSPLLSRTPRHGSPGKKPVENAEEAQQGEGKPSSQPAWLARSPHKMSVSRKPLTEDSSKAEQQQDKTPSGTTTTSNGTGTHIPFLSRSPTKLPPHHHHLHHPPNADAAQLPSTPGKGHPAEEGKGKGGLLSRFSLLRKPNSPMKSILRRSPQRLYSDDPAKIAAGTHLASPPSVIPPRDGMRDEGVMGLGGGEGRSGGEDGVVGGGGGVGDGGAQGGRKKEDRKRVDFTASTKARYEEGRGGGGDGKGYAGFPDPSAQGDALEDLAREVAEEDGEDVDMGLDLDTSPPPAAALASEPEAEDEEEGEADAQASGVTYPSLHLPALSSPATAPPNTAMPPTPSPQKRRQTFAPRDFTFRAGSQEIVFGNPTELSSPGKTGAASEGGRRRTTAAPAAAAAPSSFSEAGVDGTRRRATIRAVSAEPVGQVGARRTEPSRRLVPDANAGVDGQADQAKGLPGSRKRKFDFENANPDPAPKHEALSHHGEADEESGGSGKENRASQTLSPGSKAGGKGKGKTQPTALHERAAIGEEEEEEENEEMQDSRPAKRTKTSSSATAETKGSGRGRQGVSNARPMASTAGSATVAGTGGKRRTTLGVRPRGEKKSAALAMAGRRGGPAAAAGGACSGAGGGGGDGVSGPGAGTAGAAGGTAGNAPGKSTISRERLNALAAPKRRG
ncbi:hypothetical protein KC361_g7385 [Hortaea werneckii]|nr:hypothetical protein KC361_g7385 [Hortaea werneckii]